MDFDNICRLCCEEKLKLRSIVGDERHPQLPHQIRQLLQVEFDENDHLPQRVCKPCAGTMQRIQETLEEYRKNDARMRRQLLDLQLAKHEAAEVEDEEEIEVKIEGLNDDGEEAASDDYVVQEVKIEVLSKEAEMAQPVDEEHSEEWLEEEVGSENSDIKEEVEVSKTEEHPVVGQKRGKTKSIRIVKTQEMFHEDGVVIEEEDEVENIPVKKKRGRRSKNTEERKTTNKESKPNRQDFKCYVCKSESLGSAKALLDHLTSHNDQLPFVCTICEQETVVIKQIRSLNMHLKMHEQPVKCQYCDRRYANDRARDYHVQAFHLGDNAPCPSTCEFCGKVCPSVLSLRLHVRRHTVSYNCEQCSKSFAEKSKLKRHISRVHEQSDGYDCSLCQKRFKTIDAYEHHVRTIHEDRRDHVCDICERRFTTNAFLRTHQKHYFGGTCKPKNNWIPYYTSHINEEGIKLFQCKVCNKGNMRSIGEHLRVHFPKEYECPVCAGKFSRKSTFDRHRLTHSEIVHNCFSCEKCFISSKKLSLHMAKVHGVGEIMEVPDEEMLQFGSDEDDTIEYDVVG